MRVFLFTDLHYDSVPDGDRRIRELLKACREKKADVMIELGDLCHGIAKNTPVRDAFFSAGIPCHFSLGNHNTEHCSRAEALSFLGLQQGWYSVIHGNVKFIFLDANPWIPGKKDPYIPPEQVCWLKEELADDRYFYVILSHQSLANDHVTGHGERGIINRAEIRTVLEERNKNGRRVLLCINGHEHGTGIREIGGIHYFFLNSASYFYQGIRPMYPYAPEVHEKYPYLKYQVLYREPLYAVMDIDGEGNVAITGVEGHYLNVTPADIPMEPVWNGVSVEPRTESVNIPYERE